MTQVLGQILFNKPPPQQMSGLPPINQTQTPFQIIKSSPSLFTNGNHKMLDEVVEKSQKVLMCIKATFPFELFPDVLTIDENKVTLFCREPGYENVHGVFIENITYVTVDTSFIHSTLNITDSTSERFPKILSIHHLKKDDAFRARSYNF